MIYHRIRDLREDRDWTQADVAQKINMTQTGYSKYERGERDIPTQILIQLADLYGVSVDYLLDLDFYDSYDLHRGEFDNANLYRIDDSSSNYYLRGVDYYITK